MFNVSNQESLNVCSTYESDHFLSFKWRMQHIVSSTNLASMTEQINNRSKIIAGIPLAQLCDRG